MSKIKYFTVTLLAITFCFGAVFAQKTVKTKPAKTPIKKTFNDADLFILLQKNTTRLDEILYRSTKISEYFEDGKTTPINYEKNIIEQLPPDRSRYMIEKKSAKGIEKTEYITIGRERFIRKNDGEWKILQSGGSGMGSGSGMGEGAEPKIEVLEEKNLIEGEMLNGQKTARYEKIRYYTYTYADRVEKMTITQSFWFNPKGLLVKTLDETNEVTKKSIKRTIENYEYDVKLSIEKPLIK